MLLFVYRQRLYGPAYPHVADVNYACLYNNIRKNGSPLFYSSQITGAFDGYSKGVKDRVSKYLMD
jgi:hypothetical protein